MLQEAADSYIVSLSAKNCERSNSKWNTIMAYRNDLYQFCAYLVQEEVLDWSQVTQEHIAAYLLMMRDGQAYRPTTIARKLAALKSFFRHMRSSKAITLDPMDKLETPRVQRDLPQFLSPEQIHRLFLQIEEDTFGGQRDLAMLHMLYATGMRSSELVALNLCDFDVDNAIVICPGRNVGRERRERVLPLPSIAVEATRRYIDLVRPRLMRVANEQALFLNHHGERLTRQGFWLIIKGYARHADITTITPHMLRHSFAILMLKEGRELRSVQEMLGHAHLSTTQIYSQLAHVSLTNE